MIKRTVEKAMGVHCAPPKRSISFFLYIYLGGTGITYFLLPLVLYWRARPLIFWWKSRFPFEAPVLDPIPRVKLWLWRGACLTLLLTLSAVTPVSITELVPEHVPVAVHVYTQGQAAIPVAATVPAAVPAAVPLQGSAVAAPALTVGTTWPLLSTGVELPFLLASSLVLLWWTKDT